ncbi:hypothetical protein D3C75_1011400 [compost metagenome]
MVSAAGQRHDQLAFLKIIQRGVLAESARNGSEAFIWRNYNLYRLLQIQSGNIDMEQHYRVPRVQVESPEITILIQCKQRDCSVRGSF